MCAQKVFSPAGQEFTIRDDGRKEDEDGFVCAAGTPGLRNPLWFCVSVKITEGSVMVRDTKDPTKTTLTYSPEEWKIFTEGVKAGQFDIT